MSTKEVSMATIERYYSAWYTVLETAFCNYYNGIHDANLAAKEQKLEVQLLRLVNNYTPVEFEFNMDSYFKRAYNNMYIVSRDEQYLNIWRIARSTGFGMVPVQISIMNFSSPGRGMYGLDINKLEHNKFYDVSSSVVFRHVIDSCFKGQKKVISQVRENSNRLLHDSQRAHSLLSQMCFI